MAQAQRHNLTPAEREPQDIGWLSKATIVTCEGASEARWRVISSVSVGALLPAARGSESRNFASGLVVSGLGTSNFPCGASEPDD